MTRKSFITSLGATCKDWRSSWSFIDEKNRRIIFGAWDIHTGSDKILILSEEWKMNPNGKRSKSYPWSRDHIRLIEEEGYLLFTFPIIFGGRLENGTAIMKSIKPEITERTLFSQEGKWFASSQNLEPKFADEIIRPEAYIEGATKLVTVNSYERSAKARAACVSHHGAQCAVCLLDFEQRYGQIGRGFIHVHHVIPIGKIKKEYSIDPIKDLIPVCPNCHAMIHQTEPPLTISELKNQMK